MENYKGYNLNKTGRNIVIKKDGNYITTIRGSVSCAIFYIDSI